MKKTELLVPVKNMESLKIAIQYGADSVYMGYPVYNARWKGENFEINELKKAIDYAHKNQVKVYLTLNALIKEKEFKEAVRYAKQAIFDDVDAIIIQDLGLAQYIHRNYPQISLHASTQTTVANHYGVQVLSIMGFTRVVLARELNVGEIVQIQKICEIQENVSPIEIEIFLHGGLCIAYSGQCLMSGYCFGLAANRGMCEALCCDTYALYKNGIRIGCEKFLKPRDLCGIECLNDLILGGIHCFKIQGRTRSENYLSDVIKVYKQYMKKFEEEKVVSILSEDKNILVNSYNRGVSGGNLQMERNLQLTVRECVNEDDTYILNNKKVGAIFKIETGKKCDMAAHVFLQKLNLEYEYDKLLEKIEKLYIPFEFFLNELYQWLIEHLCKSYDVCVYMPLMIYERNCDKWYDDLDYIIRKFDIKGIVMSNISDLILIKRYKGLNLEFIANYSFNITNHYTADYLKEIGITMAILSVELNQNESDLIVEKTKIRTGVIGYGHIPLMSMKYCLLMKCNECSKKCLQPCKEEDIYTLIGGEEYLVDVNSRQTTTTLYSRKVFYQPLSSCKADFFRVDFYDETVEQMNEIINNIKAGRYCIGRDFKNHWNVQ